MDYNLIHSLVIFASLFYFGSTTLSITELKVPESIKSGSTDEIVLDCNYEVSADEHSVVVKWFYNGQVDQIYQWIPGYQKHGYPMGKLKDRIDINYHPDNETETYRAIKIKNITPDLSGNYTCKVSSDLNEDYKTKQLIIYHPADDGLHTFLMENESLIVCSASGLYPKPTLELFVSEGNETIDENDIIEEIDIDSKGFFNITKSLYFNFSSSVTFTCELSIPGTNYSESQNVEYYFENSSSRKIPSTTSFIVSLFMLLLMFIAT